MADETTPAIPDLPENLDEVSEADLRTLHGTLIEARATLLAERATDGISFARVREIVAQVRDVDTRLRTVSDAVTERVTIESDLSTLEDTPALPDPATPAAETDPAPAADPAAPEGVPATVAVAAISATDLAGERDPQPVTVPAAPRTVATASLRAPDGSRIFEPGQELKLDEIGAAVAELSRGRSFDGQVRVASIASYEADASIRGQMLTKGNIERNDELIHEAQTAWREQFDRNRAARTAAVTPEARTAAICDPLDIIRDIPDGVQAREPFSESLPSRPAGRLGYQYTLSSLLSDWAAGVVVWDEDDQAAVDPTDPATWKPVVDVTCPSTQTVIAQAITAALRFDNTTDISNPEWVRDALSKIAALRSRTKAGKLLSIVDTQSHHYDYVAPYGALDGVIQAILSILPQGQFPERLDGSVPYVLYTPPGALEAMVIDRANKAYLTDVDAAGIIAYIERECAAAGWNISVVDLDDLATGDGAPFAALNTVGVANRIPLPSLGQTYKLRLLAPEAWLYASTGAIDTGIERSPELNRQNKAQWFGEEYVMLAKNGPQPAFTLHATLCPNGARAGLATPFTCSPSNPS